MYLTRHDTSTGPRWAHDGHVLPASFTLGLLLQLPASAIDGFLRAIPRGAPAVGPLLAPLEADHEVWACGVTYQRSREAREAESTVRDVYARVYDATRPELFFKGLGWRVAGAGAPIRVRNDSTWNVPEPELTLVVNAAAEIVGYTVGNDVSSRDIEGENPLYLPQAKVYDGSCAIGPAIYIATEAGLRNVPIRLRIERAGKAVFEGETRSSEMKRSLVDLASFLGRELSFPQGAFLMTGTGIVPPDGFSLQAEDVVRIEVFEAILENEVARDDKLEPRVEKS